MKALLFDFDGTLIDSEGPAFRSWQEVYRQHGKELPLERWVACVGTIGGFDPIADLESLIGHAVDAAAIEEPRLRRKLELMEAEALRPGVHAYLAEARRLGLRVGIVTSSPREWVDEHLARLGESDGWDCIVCANHEIALAKPNPHLYRTALDAVGAEPGEAIAIEDSPNGVLAAKRAGIFCVAVPNPVTNGLDLSAADLRLQSLDELPLPELIERASGRG